MAASERILIAGAGIGGLAAGCALVRAGFDVVLTERAPELRPVGAGLTVQANAVLALDRLGLGAAVRAAGMAMGRSEIRRSDGAVLASTTLHRLEPVLGAPSVALHRARLQQVLLGGLGADRVRLGAEAQGFEASETGVALLLGDGSRIEGAALVGADGLHSRIRTALHGPSEPVYAGYTSWRGVAHLGSQLPAGHAAEMWGRGRRFGYVGIGFGEVYWFAVEDAPAGGQDAPGRARESLLERFGDFAEPVRPLLDATSEEAIVRTDICDRPPLPAWGSGRVTLLGDAAHPMTPNLGQGGCQAIEDAVVLGECLAAAPDVASGLRSYEAKRAPRAAWFMAQSRRVGRVAQARGRLACAARNTVFRLLPGAVLERQIVAAQRLPA